MTGGKANEIEERGIAIDERGPRLSEEIIDISFTERRFLCLAVMQLIAQ